MWAGEGGTGRLRKRMSQFGQTELEVPVGNQIEKPQGGGWKSLKRTVSRGPSLKGQEAV